MSLDFPSPPLVDGQIHVQNGSVWTWRETPGVWAKGDNTGQITEIVEDDSGVGYFVAGDTLFQWGFQPAGSSGNEVVTFPIAFDAAVVPKVTTSVNFNNTNTSLLYSCTSSLVSNTDFTLSKRRAQNGGNVIASGVDVDWMAVGLAPENLRKSKTVLGGGSGGDVNIVDEGEGFQIIGGKMMQWGRDTTADLSPKLITFPIEFGSEPEVFLTAYTGANRTVAVPATITTTTFEADRHNASTGNDSTTPFMWFAIGDAPPDRVMPTTVIGNGVTEFHDPAGLASWRLIGKTLECWGTTPGSTATESIVFPRTFARPPTVVTNNESSANNTVGVVVQGTITTTGVDLISFITGSTSAFAKIKHWHAIGEVAP